MPCAFVCLRLPETYNIFAKPAPFVELVWGDMLFDWQMQWSRLQILPKCQNIDPLHVKAELRYLTFQS